MNICTFLRRLFHSHISYLSLALLATLGCSFPAFCGEIHDAAKAGDLAKVKALLKDNPELVNSKPAFSSYTPLHYAVKAGCKEVVEFLLSNKADVNATAPTEDSSYEFTALHLAAIAGNKDMAELLLAWGADVKATSRFGEMPLHLAARAGSEDVAKVLLAKGADVNALTGSGWTPLHLAVANNSKAVLELLLAHGAKVNTSDDHVFSNTPLHDAAEQGYANIAELLLTKGANVNAVNRLGQTPFGMAVMHGHKDVIELLRQHGGHE
jgi:ankyrin repeat protein